MTRPVSKIKQAEADIKALNDAINTYESLITATQISSLNWELKYHNSEIASINDKLTRAKIKLENQIGDTNG